MGAVGVSLSAITRQDYGSSQSRLMFPEVFAYGYLPLKKSYFLRPGLRFGYLGSTPQMPKSIQIVESDFSAHGEIALLWESYVVPALSVGAGAIFRTIKVNVSDEVKIETDSISNRETLPFVSFKFGAGLPLLSGKLAFEPFLGYRLIFDDNRESIFFGGEVSFGF
jgi:hypothetical protein